MKRLMVMCLLGTTVCPAFAQTNEKRDSVSNALDKDLPELVVKGERPMAKMKGTTLAYDPQVLRERFQPSTAFDLLAHVPELRVQGDAVSLTGANAVLLVIDGRVNAMDAAQVVERLKALPAGQVESIDISRVAPAKYNFKGALVNVRTVSGTDQLTVMAEERIAKMRQGSTSSRASVMYDRGRLSLFGAANYSYGDSHSSSFYAMADGYRCDTHIRNFGNSVGLSGEASYRFSKEVKLTAGYYGNFSSETRKDLRMAALNGEQTLIRSRRLTDEALHSGSLELELPKKWTLSARYQNYDSPYTQYYVAGKPSDALELPTQPTQTSTQDIDSWRANLNKDFSLGKQSTLSLGLTHDFTHTAMSMDYANEWTLGKQNEWNTALYAQTDFTLWKKLSVTLALRGEKTKQLYQDQATEQETTVWNDFWVFPTLQLALPVGSKGRTLQLALQSDKQFPGYWWISPQTTVIDERTLSVGNPNMKPARYYYLNLYLLDGRRWMVALSSYYVKDGLARLPHYDESIGKTIYKGENMDFTLTNALTIQWNKTFGNYTTTATLRGSYTTDRIDHYYGADYESHSFGGDVSWNNDYQLPLNKRGGKLLLHADFRYTTPMNYAFTKWSDAWDMNAYARWIPSPRFRLELGCNNILRLSSMRWTEINIPGQELYESHYNVRVAYLRCTVLLGKQRQMKQGRNEWNERFGR